MYVIAMAFLLLSTMYIITTGILLIGIAIARNIDEVPDAGDDTLNLTPFILRGETDKARQLSAVNPELFAGVKSHAAYITVNETNKWNTFFWFFPAENKSMESTPWLIWLQGGPGASSLYGLFTEIGPLQMINGSVLRMPVTWNSDYSLLFIDNPINVGFSYSDTDAHMTNQEEVGRTLVSLVQQLVQIFPELQKAPLFISGESYAGKYVPSFGYYLHHHQNKSSPINLKGLIIGNGFTDPPSLLHYSELILQLGFMESEQAAELEKIENDAREAWKKGNIEKYLQAADWAANLGLSYVPNVYNYIHNVDPSEQYESFLSRTDVKKSLHVGSQKYISINWDVYGHFNHEFYLTVKPLLEELLEHYPVLCYNGQLDVIVGYALSVHTYRSLNWTGTEAYLHARRTPIKSKYADAPLDIIGYVKGAGNFMEVMIRAAGHMAPHDQPRATKQIIDMFIERYLYNL